MPSVSRPESFGLLAQLAYASADSAGSSGGWQVKQTVGELDAETTAALTRRMPTTLEPPFPMPEYPVDGLPRRMLVTTVGAEDGRLAVWHSVPAGRDASSRPGNVYTQCALLAPTTQRPSLLWGSPDWRTPFGAREVAATALPAGLTATPVAPVPALAEFLFDPGHWRVGTLAVIVDAVQRALDGGPIVVLAVADHEEAARWIGAVSLCTDAVSAQAIHSSSYERAGSSGQWPDLGLHLVGVPRVDGEILAGLKGVVVIDTSTDAYLGDWGGEPHRTSRGDQIAVTPWSALVLSRCVGGDDLASMADAVDQVRERLPGSVWAPAWPLALHDYSKEPSPAAADVLARSTPAEVDTVPEFYEVVAAALGTLLGDDSETRWRAMQGLAGGNPGLVLSLAAGLFVTGAVGEPDWLAEQASAPRIPDGVCPAPTQEQRESVLRALRALLEAGEPNPTWALAALRSIDLVASIGWDEDEIEGQVFALAERLAGVAASLEAWFDDVVRATAEPSRKYLREALLGQQARDVSDTVLTELGFTDAEFLHGSDAVTVDGVQPLAAVAASVLLESPTIADDLRGRAQYLQLRYNLERRSYVPELDLPVLIGLGDLGELIDRFGRNVSERVVLDVATRHLGEPSLPDLLDALVAAAHPQGDTVEALVALSRPITADHSLYTYAQWVSALELAVEDRLIAASTLPVEVRSRTQAIVLAAVLVTRSAPISNFIDPTLPMPAATEIAALGTVIAREGQSLRSELAAIDRVALFTVGSPERTDAVPAQVAAIGPAEDPLIDQIVCEVLRAAQWTFENELLEYAAYSLLKDDGHRPRALHRYLTKWIAAHNLAANRGPAAWLKRVKNKRSEDD